MPSPLRQRLFAAGFAAIAATGADRWLRRAALGRGVILTFHHVRPWRDREGFAPNRLLEITPEFLDGVLTILPRLGFEIVAMDAVPGRLEAPLAGRPFAALTFDDGYRDVVEHALPVLSRHGAPWTFFVTTDYADGQGSLWWLELEEAVRRLDRIGLALEGATLAPPSATADEKQAAFERLYWLLRSGPEERLRRAVAELSAAAGVDGRALVRDLCLRWDELRRLVRSEPALAIGAHTLTHPMLAKHPAERARAEIAESRARIEAELGVPVRHFAYPVGDPGSAGPRDFALAREAGFDTALTTRPGHLFAGHRDHMHALPRVSVNGHFQSEAAMRALLSGVPFLAWNCGRRLAVG